MDITFERGPIYTTFSFSNSSYKEITGVVQVIREATQARPVGYQYMPRYKMHQWDGYIRLCKNNRFPTGLLSLVADSLREHGFYNFQVVHYPTPGYAMESINENMLNGVTLRPYQVDAIRTLLSYGRGIAKMATNSGKTEVIAAIAEVMQGPVMVLVTKKDIMYQSAERIENRLGEPVGIIGDGVWQGETEHVTIGMIQTLSKHLDWLRLRIDLRAVMYDECFVAGTLVGGKPIENVQVGDVVTAWDEYRNIPVAAKVMHVFRRVAPSTLLRINTTNCSVVCTPNHPIYCGGDWKFASDLHEGDMVYGHQNDKLCMHLVRERVSKFQRPCSAAVPRSWQGLLLEELWQGTCVKDVIRDNDEDKSEICFGNFGKDEAEQSYEARGCSQEGKSHIDIYRTPTFCAWRKWDANTCTAEAVGRGFGRRMGDGISGEDGRHIKSKGSYKESKEIAYELQGGHSQSIMYDGHRSGWAHSLWAQGKGGGCKEGFGLARERVESIEVLERGSSDQFAQLCSDGFVYNLDVEEYHTYVANGIIVHNCHHTPANTSQAVMMTIPAPYRFGFSGTPLKNEELADLTLIGATGPVLVDIPNSELIEQGISAEPFIEMYNIDGGTMYNSDWQDAYSDCIAGNYKRNTLVAKLVRESGAKSVLVLVERIEHGQLLNQAIAGSAFVHGSCAMDERKGALDRLRDGNGNVVIATPIFDEGVDVPAVDLLVLAGGGKAPVKLLQRLGRGMRRKEGDNVLRVIDFVDDTNKYLLEHSLERARLYEQEGFNVKVLE